MHMAKEIVKLQWNAIEFNGDNEVATKSVWQAPATQQSNGE